jgi:MerR family transcriptional regulator, redox-sensitive transcriptional activator SoxR
VSIVKLEVNFKSRENFMTIGNLASRTGVPASTIRYWERIGVLQAPGRVSGQRRYLEGSIHQLAVLKLAQACGFRLDEMRHLIHGFCSETTPSRRWQELAQKKQRELDVQIVQLKAMRRVVDQVLTCRCAELVDCGRLASSVMEAAR